jgi:Fe-S-cluster containining protein
MPVFYECQRCTACCRWPGQVKLSGPEIAALAKFKKMTEDAFIQDHTRLNTDRSGLALRDKPNGEYLFLDGDHCSFQEVKPQQCRDFPSLWRFPGFQKSCTAIPRTVSAARYRQLVSQATGKAEADIDIPTPS